MDNGHVRLDTAYNGQSLVSGSNKQPAIKRFADCPSSNPIFKSKPGRV